MKLLRANYFYVPGLSPLYRKAKNRVLRSVYAGRDVHCVLCGRDSRRWIGNPEHGACPWCGSFARHRLLWLFLQRDLKRFERGFNLLYFAPDECLYDRLAGIGTVRCTTTDLLAPDIDVRADITDLPFANDSYDAILCTHVLEHIPDDAAAMRELFRVLKPGGEAFVQVPLSRQRAITDEDSAVVDPKQRAARFGQFDHVRRYGLDIVQRLETAGFNVSLENAMHEIPEADAKRFGLWDDAILYCCKPSPVQNFEPAPSYMELELKALQEEAVAAAL